MTINITLPDVDQNLHPKITVLGVGGSGGNAVNNMINSNLEGVDFLIANTDAQALQISSCQNKIQLGLNTTRGLGAGMRPDVGKQAAEEAVEELKEKLNGSHMLFIAAGMGGGTGTGAAPVIAKLARERGILTVGVVTKPFHFEGTQRMKLAEKGIEEIQQHVDTLLTIPNQNLFRIANEKTTFSDAFKMADDVLYAGVRGVTDLMVQPGMINLDFSDVKTVMSEMGKAMMGTGEASGEGRAIAAAEAAIANPLIDDVSLKGARGLIINITGGKDITLYEVDEAANRIKQEVDDNANIIYGTTCDDRLEGLVRVSIVATGIDNNNSVISNPIENYSNISIDNSVYNKPISSENNLHLNPDNINIENENLSMDKNISISDDPAKPEEVQASEEGLPEQENLKTEDDLETNVDNDESLEEDLHANIDEIKSENHLEENISHNSNVDTEISSQESNSAETETSETSVRRLSLFDTVREKGLETSESQETKAEPVLDGNIETSDSEEIETNILAESEFQAEENEIEEEYNQETEEELLDIPTFLRRQAN